MARTYTSRRIRLITAGVGFAGIAATLGTAAAHADAGDTLLAAASAANPDDPAVFYYSADPTNIFSPVYTISPTGAEEVISTDGSGDIVGTQEFTVSYFGIPLDTFNGGVEYSPVSSPLDPFGSPYVEDVSTLGAAGTLIPDNTGFLTEEFGGGYGYLTDLANITGTSPVASEYILTPFGPENITNFVNEFMHLAGSVTDSAGATAADSTPDVIPGDLLSDATTNLTDANQLLTALPTVGDASTAGLLAQQTMDLQDIAQLGTSESALSSYDNGALTDLLNPLFNSVNQGWDQAAAAVLTADQALQSAANTGSDTAIDTAIFNLLGAQLESPVFSSDLIDLGAHFLTGIDPFSAGVDTASAIDPSIFADLLSSIGL